MPLNVFGNSSHDNNNKFDTGMFAHKPYLRTDFIEAKIEEDIDLKNQFRIKKIPDPISIRKACSRNYVDNLSNDPSISKNTAHKDLNAKNFTNSRFAQVNQLPQIGSHLTTKLYVNNAIDELSLVGKNQDDDFKNKNQTNKNSITLSKK